MDYSTLSEADKGYLAGILDGEGTLSYYIPHKKHKSYYIQITSVDKELLDWVKSKVGGAIYMRKPKENCKDTYVWDMKAAAKLISLLTELLPYLKIKRKRERARMLVEEYRSCTPRNGRYTDQQLADRVDFDRRFALVK